MSRYETHVFAACSKRYAAFIPDALAQIVGLPFAGRFSHSMQRSTRRGLDFDSYVWWRSSVSVKNGKYYAYSFDFRESTGVST